MFRNARGGLVTVVHHEHKISARLGFRGDGTLCDEAEFVSSAQTLTPKSDLHRRLASSDCSIAHLWFPGPLREGGEVVLPLQLHLQEVPPPQSHMIHGLFDVSEERYGQVPAQLGSGGGEATVVR